MSSTTQRSNTMQPNRSNVSVMNPSLPQARTANTSSNGGNSVGTQPQKLHPPPQQYSQQPQQQQNTTFHRTSSSISSNQQRAVNQQNGNQHSNNHVSPERSLMQRTLSGNGGGGGSGGGLNNSGPRSNGSSGGWGATAMQQNMLHPPQQPQQYQHQPQQSPPLRHASSSIHSRSQTSTASFSSYDDSFSFSTPSSSLSASPAASAPSSAALSDLYYPSPAQQSILHSINGMTHIDATLITPSPMASHHSGNRSSPAVIAFGPAPFALPPSNLANGPPLSIPFAPSPHLPQNICDNPEFFERYRVVWTQIHPIHDGIERPAVLDLVPQRQYLRNKRCLDIGSGSGRMCRYFRTAKAFGVVGIDSSWRMVESAVEREKAEEADALAASGNAGEGFGTSLKRFLSSHLTEDQLAEKQARQRMYEEARRERDREKAEKAKLASTASSSKSGDDLTVVAPPAPKSFFDHFRRSKSSNQLQQDAEKDKEKEKTKLMEAELKREKQLNSSRQSSDAQQSSSQAVTVSSSSSSSSSTSDHHFRSIKYLHTSIEDWDVSSELSSFHLITCCMTMQFIWDLQAFARKVYSLLLPTGVFVCSVDHPVATCSWGIHPIAIKNDDRDASVISYFPLDAYHEQGERRSKYYIENVIKYHRRVETYINTFLSVGFVLEKISEPTASKEMEMKYPELKTWRRKPIFLCMRWRKPKASVQEDFFG